MIYAVLHRVCGIYRNDLLLRDHIHVPVHISRAVSHISYISTSYCVGQIRFYMGRAGYLLAVSHIRAAFCYPAAHVSYFCEMGSVRPRSDIWGCIRANSTHATSLYLSFNRKTKRNKMEFGACKYVRILGYTDRKLEIQIQNSIIET